MKNHEKKIAKRVLQHHLSSAKIKEIKLQLVYARDLRLAEIVNNNFYLNYTH